MYPSLSPKKGFPNMQSTQLLQTLQSVFGFDSLRQGQQPVIESVMNGYSAAAIFPTLGQISLLSTPRHHAAQPHFSDLAITGTNERSAELFAKQRDRRRFYR